MEGLVVRLARVDDAAALAALWREMDELHARLLPGYFRRPPNSPPAEQLASILRAGDETIHVAEVLGAVVGLVHAQLFDTPPQPALTPRRRAHIDSLVVAEPARRRGLGTRLLHDAASWAKAAGAEEILLTVWAGNLIAEKFYESLGFSRVNSVLGRSL